MTETLVRLARDARMHAELYPESELSAILRGRIIKSFGRSRMVRFYLLQDFTGKIQILIDRNSCAPDIADSFSQVPDGGAVEVEGRVGRSETGKLSVFPTRPAALIPPLTIDALLAGDDVSIATQLLLARLENRIRAFFVQEDYSELAARHLSSTWDAGGLQPLEVSFPGQSRVPFYLTVSPVPQLLRAILTTAQPRFFIVSRSFATNFVATQNGAESIIAGAITVGMGARDATALLTDAIHSLVGDYTTGLDDDLRAELQGHVLISETNELREPGVYPGLHVHITHGLDAPAPGGFTAKEAFRVCWRGEFDVAEGYTFMLGGQESSTLILNLERFLPLLRAGDNRRLENLEAPLPQSGAQR